MKKYRKISIKKTGRREEEDKKGHLNMGRKNKEEDKKTQENARRHKKVIATELTVNSSISTLGMVYTLL